MESSTRDCLRQNVRRIVHRACWRRLDGDETRALGARAEELNHLLDSVGGPRLPEKTLETWIRHDETEFERAMLISDLVARRMSRTVGDVTPKSDHRPPAPRVELPSPERKPRTQAPAIADLLDEMLSQQRPAHAVGQ